MTCRMRVLATLCCVFPVLFALASPCAASARTLYVSASGHEQGNGTRTAPFNTLAAVEQASRRGDAIVVLASPSGVAPLDGGIALKDGQSLIGDRTGAALGATLQKDAARITNTSTAHNGDAVVLADKTSVSNLVIVGAHRSAVYGQDVTGVSIAGNTISASNTSCTPGEGYEGKQFSGRPMHGYAAVMVDYTHRTASLLVAGNRIHDGTCMDGIHVRAGGASRVTGRIDRNVVTRLQQGKGFVSVLGIALETKDSASLSVTSDGNTQTFIGNPLGGVPDADCEGLLAHQTGGDLRWTITHNEFAHAMGGSSCNGAEFFISENKANSTIAIADSTFIDAQGDMVQNINLGSGDASLTLERVTIAYTRLATAPAGPPESRGSTLAGNEAGRPRGHCLMLVTQGPEGANRASLSDSAFSNCGGDGVFMYYAPFLGMPGASRELILNIDHSTITSDKGYGLRWANYGDVDRASVKVRNSFIGGALDKAAVALLQNPSGAQIKTATFDFGSAQALGGNCLGVPGTTTVELAGVDATFVGNFWGSNIAAESKDKSGAPWPDTIWANGRQIDTSEPLPIAPATCGR